MRCDSRETAHERNFPQLIFPTCWPSSHENGGNFEEGPEHFEQIFQEGKKTKNDCVALCAVVVAVVAAAVAHAAIAASVLAFFKRFVNCSSLLVVPEEQEAEL
jgi:hypothetical protein